MNPFLQFFELAALSWLLMEGIYYYSTLKPLFNDNNTVPIVFYFAVGWGKSHLSETVIYIYIYYEFLFHFKTEALFASSIDSNCLLGEQKNVTKE